MKHFYFWMLALFCSTLAFSQFTEDFESDISANGWTQYATEDFDPGFVQTDLRAHGGTYSYYHNDAQIPGISTSFLVSPAYTVQIDDSFTAWVNQNHSVDYYGYSGIWISTTSADPVANPGAFTELQEMGAGFAEDQWTQVSLDLSAYVGQTVYFAFKYTGDFNHEFFVDDVVIGEACDLPQATTDIAPLCASSQFNVNVDLTSLGSSASVIISDGTNNVTATAAGSYVMGPYTSGTDVSIQIVGGDNSTCSITLTATYDCPPANDNCSGAVEVTAFPYNTSGDASGATQTAMVSCGNETANDGIWYTFEGESAMFTINFLSTGWDSAIGVFSGSCDALQCVEFEDSAIFSQLESLSFVGQAGVTYYVNVGHRSNITDQPEGPFTLEILSEEIPCGSPANLAVAAVTDLSATANWQPNAENESYDLIWGPAGFTPGTTPNLTGITATTYTITGLTPDTEYDIYVRGNCTPGYSNWVGPVSFTTLEPGAILPGTDCIHPIIVGSLPYTTTDNTSNYGDDYDGGQGSNCGTAGQYYLGGDDVVYAYTPATDTSIDISMSPTATYSGIFVYEDCNDIGVNCIAGFADYSTNERLLEDILVTGGQTYYILISTWPSPQSTGYTLEITENTCIPIDFTYTTVNQCETGEFSVTFDITSLGDNPGVVVTDSDGVANESLTSPGAFTVGPYSEGEEIVFTFTTEDPNCTEELTIVYTCPAENDECVDAEELTVGENFAENAVYGNNIGATASATMPAPGCAGYQGGEVWYTVEVPETGHIIIETGPGEGIVDTGLAVYSGSCDGLTLIECDDDDSPTGAYSYIELENQTPGSILYIAVWEYFNDSTGTFQVSAYDDLTCIPPIYTLENVPNCDEGTFNVVFNFTSVGGSGSVTLTDNQGNPAQTITEPGTVTFGPYESMTSVTFTGDAGDPNCAISQTTTYRCGMPGDNCENPLIVDSLPYITQDNTSNYYDDYNGGQGSNCGSDSQYYLNGDDVVYAYTATSDTSIDISMTPNGSWSGLFVYESCADIGVNCYAGVANAGGGERLIEELPVMAGQTYYILISTWAAPQSVGYTLEITENTCIASEYTYEVVNNCEAGEYSVTVDITSLGSSESLVFTDSYSVSNETVTAPGTITMGPYDAGEQVTITLTADDPNCTETFNAISSCPAANDNCIDANELSVGANFAEFAELASNLGATSGENMPAPGCAYYQGGEVWFTAVVPETGHIIVETRPGETITDTGMAVYSGSCDALTLLDCDDDSSDFVNFSLIELDGLTPGTVLYIAVWEYGNDTSGTFQVSAFDDLTCIPAEYTVDEIADCDAGTYEVVFNFTSLGSLSSIAISDNQASEVQTVTTTGTVTFGPYESGTTVTFNGVASDTNCSFTETAFYRCALLGDNCENPLIVGDLPYITEDNTANYFDDYSGGQGTNCGEGGQYYLGGDDVVYSYTPTTDTSIDIILTPTATYSGIFVYESCEDIGVNCIAGVANGTANVRTIDDLTVTAGQTYYILISTWPAPQSTGYTLEITENTCVPAEFTYEIIDACETDEFSIALDITSLGSNASYNLTDNLNITDIVITQTGSVTIGPYPQGQEITFSIETEDPNCSEEFEITYYCPADNDDCMDASALTVGNEFDSFPQTAVNVGATPYANMPAPGCAGYQGGEIWYSVVVPASGEITLETGPVENGGVTDTGMAVYSGTCDALTLIECDDDDSDNGLYSLVELTGQTPGSMLYVAVWEYGNNAFGSFAVSAYSDSVVEPCVAPVYTTSTELDCEAGTYTYSFDVTSMGSSASFEISDSEGNAITVDAPGVYTSAAITEGTEVIATVSTGDENCNSTEVFFEECVVEPCVAPEYTAMTTVDCDANTFIVNFNFISLGSSESINLNYNGNTTTVNAVGEVEIGPFEAGSEVAVEIIAADPECNNVETFTATCEEAPENDECAGAFDLAVGEDFNEFMQTVTNVGATNSDLADPDCGDYAGGDVWFMVTVPENGELTVETQSNGDGVVSTGMAAYAGSCGNLTELICEDGDNGFTSISEDDLTPGTVYYIRVWSNGGESGTFNISAWSNSLGVTDLDGIANVRLYPNPTSDVLNITGVDIKDIQIFAASGKLVNADRTDNVIQTRNLPTGTYIIRITDAEGNVIHKKFIKK